MNRRPACRAKPGVAAARRVPVRGRFRAPRGTERQQSRRQVACGRKGKVRRPGGGGAPLLDTDLVCTGARLRGHHLLQVAHGVVLTAGGAEASSALEKPRLRPSHQPWERADCTAASGAGTALRRPLIKRSSRNTVYILVESPSTFGGAPLKIWRLGSPGAWGSPLAQRAVAVARRGFGASSTGHAGAHLHLTRIFLPRRSFRMTSIMAAQSPSLLMGRRRTVAAASSSPRSLCSAPAERTITFTAQS